MLCEGTVKDLVMCFIYMLKANKWSTANMDNMDGIAGVTPVRLIEVVSQSLITHCVTH